MKFLSRNVRPSRFYSAGESTSRAFALETTSSFTTSAIQAGFYYDYAEPPRSATSILRFLLHQVLSGHPALLEYVLLEIQESYDLDMDVASPLADVILHLAKHEPVYIFLDCLDEFSPTVRDKINNELLSGIVHVHGKDLFRADLHCPSCQHRTSQLKVCFSTRSKDEIFWPVEHLDLSTGDAANGLIDDAYLDLAHTWDVSANRRALRSTLEDLVFLPNTLGLFIWLKIVAKLQLSWHGVNTGRLELCLTDFPTVGQDLFEYILESLERRCPSDAGKLRMIVRWLAFARRPLTVPEFQQALGLGPTVHHRPLTWAEWTSAQFESLCSSISWEDNAAAIRQKLEESASGVVFDVNTLGIFETRDNTIYVVHRTIRDCLEQDFLQEQPHHTHRQLASRCISLLMMTSSRELEDGTDDLVPFLSYSATRWHEHHARCNLILDRSLTNPRSPLLRAWFPKWWQHQSATEHDLKLFPAYPTEGIVLAFLGEEQLIEHLLSRKLMAANQSTKSGELWTPLMAAAWSGHTRIVELLLTRRDNNAVNPAHDARALIHAIKRRHITTAQTLMMYLVKPTAGPTVLTAWVEPERTSALGAAVAGGWVDYVRLLLDRGADVNAGDNRGDFALRPALDAGSFQMVEFLLSRGATPISPSSWAGFEITPSASKLWKALSNAGLDNQALDCRGDTLIHAVAGGVSDDFDQELLMSTCAMDILGARGRFGDSPLRRAVRGGRTQLIQHLYDTTSMAFAYGSGPFLDACEAAYPDVVKIFLDMGKSPNKYK